MEVVHYPPNSKKSKTDDTPKQEAPRVKETNPQMNAKVKKKSVFKRVFEEFFVKDIKDLKDYVIFDLIVPKAKDLVSDTIDGVKNELLYGDNKSHVSGRPKTTGTYVNYGGYSYRETPRKRVDEVARNAFDGTVFISDFDEKGNRVNAKDLAFSARDDMLDISERFPYATIADLYEIVGITTAYTDSDWGWTRETLSRIQLKPTNGGWLIIMPKAVPVQK